MALTVLCCRSSGYYAGGTNGGAGPSGSPSAGPPSSSTPAEASYSAYYHNDVYAPSAKTPKKKPPMHKGGKSAFAGPLVASAGSAAGYQPGPSGPGSYNQYGQGYGQGKKAFVQNQGGAGGYSYSTAYPSQVTGGSGGSQDYSYEGESIRSPCSDPSRSRR